MGIIWDNFGIIWNHFGVIWYHLGIIWNHLGDTWCHLVVIPVDSDSQSNFLSNQGSQSVSQWVSEIAKSRARPLWNRVGYKNTNLLSPPWVTKMLIHYLWGSKRAIWNIIIKNCRVELKILPVHPDAPSSSNYGGNPSITPLVWGPHHIPPVVKGSGRPVLPQQLLLAVSHVHCLTGQHSLLLIICQFSIWNKNHNATETLKLNELARRFFRNYPPPWNCCLTLSVPGGLRFLDF